MTAPHIVAVCGSLREGSHTRTALREALGGASSVGASTELLDPREFDLPMFDPDVSDQGDGPELRARLEAADAIILGTPMYHGSYTNVIKNVLDYSGFEEFEGTTVGLLGVSGGSFPISALDHLRGVCRALDAWVLPHEAAIPQASNVVSEDEITDEDLAERVQILGHRVVQYADIEPDPTTFAAGENIGADQ